MNIYQPQKKILLKIFNQRAPSLLVVQPQRYFAEPTESNVLKGQHVRYIPKKRLSFDVISPEGPMTLVFQSSDNFYKRIHNWKISSLVAMPAATMAYYTFGMTYWWAYPMLFTPTALQLIDYAKLKLVIFKTEVHKMWLYQNGDQILVQTYDKMFHRLNIIDNQEHEIVENKDHLVFVMNNSGREYLVANKNCAVIDYDLIDRIMKGISVDTLKFQKLYNRLLYRQTPLNLRPSHFNKYVPQCFNINSNKTIWKILNRTIYREEEQHKWLRNQESKKELLDKSMSASQREVTRKLIENFGLRHLYPEDLFYKTHQITKGDFLQQLESAKSQQERDGFVMKLYDDETKQGRKGVVDLERSSRIIRTKADEKEKFIKFAKKYSGAQDNDLKISFASFKDLA